MRTTLCSQCAKIIIISIQSVCIQLKIDSNDGDENNEVKIIVMIVVDDDNYDDMNYDDENDDSED